MKSLRWRLVLLQLTLITPVWLALAAAAYVFMLDEVDAVFDHQLEQVGATLFNLDLAELKSAVDAPGFHQFGSDDAFSAWIWSADGSLLFRSEFAPHLPFSEAPQRFETMVVDGHRWRILRAREPEDGHWLAVARPLRERDELAAQLAAGLALPWVLSLAVMLALIWFSIGRGLSPLTELSRQVASRRPDDLAPLGASETPLEAQPLVDEINLLFSRLDQAMSAERRFTADAAHELRTPLAAIRVQLEVAQGEQEPTVRQHAIAQALRATERATRLTEQLLILARLDHLEALGDTQVFPLDSVVREALADRALRALDRGVELVFEGEGGPVRGAMTLLQQAIGNLVDNAIAHSPAGGVVTVSLAVQGDKLCLTIQDQGPGLPADELGRLGERFYRVGATRPGSGLGLSIVRRVVALHGGQIEFTSPGGLCAMLHLPLVMLADQELA